MKGGKLKPLLMRSAIWALRNVYLNPDDGGWGDNHEYHYNPDSGRRILLPTKLRDQLDVPKVENPNALFVPPTTYLNFLLRRAGADGCELSLVRVAELEELLGREHDTTVREFMQKFGSIYYEALVAAVPGTFNEKYRPMMDLLSFMLGAPYKNESDPVPGFAYYSYKKRHYPFEAESPAEAAMWVFAQRVASALHSDGGDIKELGALVKHDDDRVFVTSRELHEFTEDEIPLVL